MDEQLIARFWKRVDRRGIDECWPSVLTRGPRYGRLSAGSLGRLYMHRVSFEIHFGAIPDGMMVCHTCDNPPCVNPRHLFIGRMVDNMRDCIAKGRFAFPDPRPGTSNNHNKLSENDVLTIRSQRGSVSQRALARMYGVSQGTISHIMTGRNWRWFKP